MRARGVSERPDDHRQQRQRRGIVEVAPDGGEVVGRQHIDDAARLLRASGLDEQRREQAAPARQGGVLLGQPADRSLEAAQIAGLAPAEVRLQGEEANGGGIAGVATDREGLGGQLAAFAEAAVQDGEPGAMDQGAPLAIG